VEKGEGGDRVEGRGERGEGGSQRGWQRERISVTTNAREGAHAQVHLRAPTREKKAMRALRIMIRHFGITTKRRSHAFLRAVEFYI